MPYPAIKIPSLPLMGLFRRTPESDTRKFIRGMCKAMYFSFNGHHDGKKETRTIGEIAAKCLETRPGWTRTKDLSDGCVFTFENGESIRIDFETDHLGTVLIMIGHVEVDVVLSKANAGPELSFAIHYLVEEEIAKFFSA